MSALFESNPALIEIRIALAERLIAARELELFNSRMLSPELRALNHASLALRALAGCRKATVPRTQDESRPRPFRREPVRTRSKQACASQRDGPRVRPAQGCGYSLCPTTSIFSAHPKTHSKIRSRTC